MVSRQNLFRIAVFLAVMVGLHGYLLVREWSHIQRGYADFSIFYTAGQILRQGRGGDLYNDALQESVQRSFAAAVSEQGEILPYNHPPFEAVVFRPLARFSYLTSYKIWMAINCVMVVMAALVLRRNLPALGQFPRWLWVLAGFGFPPIGFALIQGQDSIWILLCYCMAFAAMRKRADGWAGIWLGLGLCKFHFIVPFMLAPLLQRRWKLIGAFAATGAGLVGIGLWAVGVRGVLEYPHYAWWTDHVAKFSWNLTHAFTPNLRGALLTPLPVKWWPVGDVVVVLVSLAVLGCACYQWLRAGESWDWRALVFAANLVATVLVSYHALAQDLSMLLLAVLVLLDFWMGVREGDAQWVRWLVGLFFFMPLYILLFVRMRELQLIAWLVLALFVALWKAAGVAERESHDAELVKATE
jgi:hypothetical protein